MKKYHVIKRDSGLNVTSNKRRKKGLDWFTQTKIGSRPLGYKCEIGEKGEYECNGANEYLNRVFDVLDEYWQ